MCLYFRSFACGSVLQKVTPQRKVQIGGANTLEPEDLRKEYEDLEKKICEGKNVNSREERKRFFKRIKQSSGSCLTSILEMLSNILLSDTSQLLRSLIFDQILDIQELVKASICRGITRNFKNVLPANLDFLYQKCKTLTNKVKLTALKFVISDWITFTDVEIMPQLANVTLLHTIDTHYTLHTTDPIEGIFKVIQEDTALQGITVLSLQNETVFCIFDTEEDEVIFFNNTRILFETKLNQIKVVKRKEVFYISNKGKNNVLSQHSFTAIHF
jgi:hypothetical protein